MTRKNKLTLNQYLQGDNPNLVGTIYGFRKTIKGKDSNYNLNNKEWYSAIFYLDHLSGRIERYAVNNSNKNNSANLLANKFYQNDIFSNLSTKGIDKIFFQSFIIDLFRTYNLNTPVSYTAPNTEFINSSLLMISNTEYNNWFKTEERKLYIKPENIKDIPQICVNKSFYDVNHIKLALANIGYSLTSVNSKKDYAPIVLNLKSMLNSRTIKTENDILYNVKKFNALTRVKLDNLV